MVSIAEHRLLVRPLRWKVHYLCRVGMALSLGSSSDLMRIRNMVSKGGGYGLRKSERF
jgi:hypothetical protein